jgi:uncharacterized membrane protein YhaH (DUF805 family)
MRPTTPQRLHDLHRNLVVKLVAVIPVVCPLLNNCDIEGVPTHQIFALSLPFMLYALFVSLGSILDACFPL